VKYVVYKTNSLSALGEAEAQYEQDFLTVKLGLDKIFGAA
jgi:hypothetical protein